jgi:hypothetical protein
MRTALLILASLLCRPVLMAQENTFRLTVVSYQWTTSHKTLTFSWPGHSNTSCSGNTNVNGYISGGGNFSASGTTSDTCSTTYTPPTNQNIDIQKPVVYILAETENSRMVLTCTRNVRWSQCHALNPGAFMGRNDRGHFEVQGISGKGKEEWIRYDIVQQIALSREQTPAPPMHEAPASIEAPQIEKTNAPVGYPARWKSMTSGSVRTLRFEGEYIYGETVLSDQVVKAGAFFLMEAKKVSDKYVGRTNGRLVSAQGGKSCTVTWPIELTLVTPERIEGRGFVPPANAKMNWDTCTYLPPADWVTFTWIPVR